MPDHTNQDSTRLPSPLACLLIVLGFLAVTFGVYGTSLANNFVSFDDPYVIVHNLAIRSLDFQHLKAMFSMYDPELYIPLTFVSFALNYAIGGIDPFSYHLVNLLLHAINALLVSWLMLSLTRNRAIALLLGLLFAVHPVNTETVVWATARKELLSSFFAFLALLLFIRYRRDGKRWALATSIVSFVFGLLAKVNVFTLPVLLLLLEWREKRTIDRRTGLIIVPYFLLSIVFGLIGIIPKTRIITSTTLLEKVLMTAKGTIFYLQKFTVPTHLSVLYPNASAISLKSPDFAVSVLLFLVVIGLILLSLRKTRDIAFGMGFFFLAIAPTFIHFNRNGAIQSGTATGIQIASDHYLYLPSFGLLFLVGMLLLWWIRMEQRLQIRERNIVIASIASFILLCTFSYLSNQQSLVWATSETLYLSTLRSYPASALARVNLSVIYRNTDRPNDEKRILEEGLAFGRNARLETGLGTISARNGNIAGAEQFFALAMATDPTDAQPHFSRGAMLANMNKFDEALMEYQKALALDPQYVDALSNLGSLEVQRGHADLAEEYFRRAIAINPGFITGYLNLGYLLTSEKRIPEAIISFERILEIDSTALDARMELVALYLTTKNGGKALEQIKEILRIDPQNEQAKAILKEMIRLGIVGAK